MLSKVVKVNQMMFVCLTIFFVMIKLLKSYPNKSQSLPDVLNFINLFHNFGSYFPATQVIQFIVEII